VGASTCDYLAALLRESEIIDWRNLIWAANQLHKIG
jgi:hypothetical protein